MTVSTFAPHSPADIRIGGGRTIFLVLTGALAFAVFGVALILAPHSGFVAKVVGGLTVALFGPFPIYAGVRLHRAGCVYVLAADGIQFPLYGWPMLPWSEIQGTRIVARRGGRYLAVDAQNGEQRLRQMKSGSRVARRNLRSGLGLVSISEQLAPGSLEELQAEIERRRAPLVPSSDPAAPGGTGISILPMSRTTVVTPVREVSLRSTRTLRNVAAAHAVVLLLAILRAHSTASPRAVLLAIAAALLVGAVAVQFRAVLAGLATIVAAEVGFVILALTAGNHVAAATRILYLFFPFCVLFLASAAWPRKASRHV